MEFVCNLSEIKDVAINVALAISSKTSLTILEGILLECENNILKLTAYDLSLGIVKTVKVQQQKEGKIVLKAQLLIEILKKLNGETIHFSTIDNLTVIKSNKTEYKIAGIKADSYPLMPKIEEKEKIVVKDKILKDAIFKTLFAVSINSSQNPVLCGSLFSIKENTLTLVSVDGYRIAIANCSIQNSNFSGDFVVSSKTLNEISKLLKEEEEAETLIEIDSKHVVFKINGYYILTRLLQGSFLDYKEAIPKKCDTIIEIETKILEQSLTRVSVMVTQKISILMKILQNQIYLECESSLGKATDFIKTEIKGAPLEKIAFNNKFMLDVLKHCQTDKIRIGFNGPVMPIKIEPQIGNDFLYLILPVRLR